MREGLGEFREDTSNLSCAVNNHKKPNASYAQDRLEVEGLLLLHRHRFSEGQPPFVSPLRRLRESSCSRIKAGLVPCQGPGVPKKATQVLRPRNFTARPAARPEAR